MMQEIFKSLIKLHPQQAPTIEVKISLLDQNRQFKLQLISDDQILSSEKLMQAGFIRPQDGQSFSPEVIEIDKGLCKAAGLVWGLGGTSRLRNRTPGPGIVVELALPVLQPSQKVTDHA